jgi:putative N6-adenine-specific DNA methylase
MEITLIATTTMGLEKELSYELKKLGYLDQTIDNGRVEFKADLEAICRTNLWLRTAGRIMLKIGNFTAETFDELFENTKNLPWGEFIGKNDAFIVNKITAKNATLFSKSDSQSITKKAIAESLKAYHKTSHLPETGAIFNVRIQNEKDSLIMSIDTSGSGLNKRGYRANMNEAPLKETLAAGLVMLSRWKPEKEVLLDPMCGTATILIEAGMIAKNIAPGIKRSFVSESWSFLPKSLWEKAREEALSKIKHDVEYNIYGSDIDWRALKTARENMKLAGIEDIYLQNQPLKESRSRFKVGKIITNPPYGERLANPEEAEILYKEMGEVFRENFPTWNYYVLSPHEQLDKITLIKSAKRRKLYNGGIKCHYYMYF